MEKEFTETIPVLNQNSSDSENTLIVPHRNLFEFINTFFACKKWSEFKVSLHKILVTGSYCIFEI